jgi:hypothetical protein
MSGPVAATMARTISGTHNNTETFARQTLGSKRRALNREGARDPGRKADKTRLRAKHRRDTSKANFRISSSGHVRVTRGGRLELHPGLWDCSKGVATAAHTDISPCSQA